MVAIHGKGTAALFGQHADEFVACSDRQIYLGQNDSGVFGCLIAEVGEETFLHALGLLPSDRGKGLGSWLVKQVVDILEHIPIVRDIWTCALEGRPKDQSRFEQHGFAKVVDIEIEGYVVLRKGIR